MEASEAGNDKPNAMPERRYTRRISDEVLIVFHQACDQEDIQVAGLLLGVLELMLNRPQNLLAGRERRVKDSLVMAHERLWALRHLAVDDSATSR